MDGRRARMVLGVGDDAGPLEIRHAFRARALVAHPDRGGSGESFAELVDALGSIAGSVPRAHAAPRAPLPAGREHRPRFDAYDSPRRPAPARTFADALRAATARLG